MKIPGPQGGSPNIRPLPAQYSSLNFDDGTDALVRGIGQLGQGIEDVQAVNAARVAKARAKADAAAHDSLFAQAQDFTTQQLHGYDEAPVSKPEGTTSIDTLTVEDLETAGGPGKHVAGYLDSRGNEAYEKASGVTEGLKKKYDELLALAGNETQREMLGKSLERLKSSVQLQMANHEGAQLRVAEQAASKALTDTTLRTAANLYDKPDELKPFVDDALASIKRTVLPEEYEAQSTAFLAGVSKARIAKYVAAGNLDGAEQQLTVDSKVLGDDAPKLQELLTAKKDAAAKKATEFSAEAIAGRTADKVRNPYGFVDEADENKLREAVDGVFPEKHEEMQAVIERRINAEEQRRKSTIDSWTREAKSLRLDGGTAAIYPELRAKLKKYNPDYLEAVKEDDRRRWEHSQARKKGSAEARAADQAQKYRNKLALTRMKSLPWEEQADFANKYGFEGLGLDELGQAQLEEQQRKATNYQSKGFGQAKEALDNDIERATAGKALKGEDPSARFEIKADAAAELEQFIDQHQRPPTADERAKIVSSVALRQKTKPRFLDSLRGPGEEFPFQQQKRESVAPSAPSKLPPGRYESKSKPGTFFIVDAQGNKKPE